MKQVFNIFRESKISRSIESILYMKCAGKSLCTEHYCFESIELVTGLVQNLKLETGSFGTLSIYDDNGIENVKKGFMRKTTTLHVHHTVWYISLPKMHHNERYSRWRHLFILMCQLEAHRFLKQKIPLFYSLQIWIPKTMFVNSDVSYCLMWRFVEEVYKILSFVLSNLGKKWKFNTK